jgi:hypothetical protein
MLALAVTMALASACAKSSPTGPVTSDSTVVITVPPANTQPVSTATVSEKTATACPYIPENVASNDSGMRLDRITEIIQAGRLVGCRFYALQHATLQCDEACLQGERLPPGDVPAIEIRLTEYASTVDAHNAFVKTGEAGTNDEQDEIVTGNTGLCYLTTLWKDDDGQDWACAFSKGSTAVVIRTVVNGSSLNVQAVAHAVYSRV